MLQKSFLLQKLKLRRELCKYWWTGLRQLTEWLQSGSSQLLTLITETPGGLLRDLPCVQQASYLEGGPLMWMFPCTFMLIKNPVMMMMGYSSCILRFPSVPSIWVSSFNTWPSILSEMCSRQKWQMGGQKLWLYALPSGSIKILWCYLII